MLRLQKAGRYTGENCYELLLMKESRQRPLYLLVHFSLDAKQSKRTDCTEFFFSKKIIQLYIHFAMAPVETDIIQNYNRTITRSTEIVRINQDQYQADY